MRFQQLTELTNFLEVLNVTLSSWDCAEEVFTMDVMDDMVILELGRESDYLKYDILELASNSNLSFVVIVRLQR